MSERESQIDLARLRGRYVAAANEALKWLTAATSVPVLEEHKATLEGIRDDLRSAKIAVRESGPATLADELLGEQSIAAALAHEATMWIQLREGRPHEAWASVVDAEEHACLAMRTPVAPGIEDAFAHRYAVLQEVLFPRMTFLSAGFIFTSRKCTICRSDLSSCDHVLGRIYAGQVCGEYGYEGFEGDHVAIVDHPMDKHCYVARQRESQGPWLDRLTGEHKPFKGSDRDSTSHEGLRISGTIMTHRTSVGSEL